MLKPFLKQDVIEAGCDEAGRGCIAGPVVAAAVVLSRGSIPVGLDDSKKLSPRKRSELKERIEEQAVGYGIGVVDEAEIDRINILNASILAMQRAVAALPVNPGHLIIDGNRFSPIRGIPHSCVVKGDGKFASVAAASILAKTFRDRFMGQLHDIYPNYGWNRNKGYPTASHRQAILKYGPCKHHRRSFRLLNGQLQMSFS